jgi:hypothetical protein
MKHRNDSEPLDSNAVKELRRLAIYCEGLADGTQNNSLFRAAYWLKKFSDRTCRQGYVGCYGGETCNSDHK